MPHTEHGWYTRLNSPGLPVPALHITVLFMFRCQVSSSKRSLSDVQPEKLYHVADISLSVVSATQRTARSCFSQPWCWLSISMCWWAELHTHGALGFAYLHYNCAVDAPCHTLLSKRSSSDVLPKKLQQKISLSVLSAIPKTKKQHAAGLAGLRAASARASPISSCLTLARVGVLGFTHLHYCFAVE